uniref:IRS-type PTB domain-containing protein n=1 Tax=Lutzomyia longipalpis TaxID=7200 RepID=A0A1B0CP92_LUTLO
MDVDAPVCAGSVIIQAQSKNRISKKKSSNHKYCLLFKASRNGIERLEIADSETDKNPRIVTLENCVKITSEAPPANLIHIVTKTENVTVGTHGEEELKKWLSALQTVAFKEKSTCSLNRGSAIEEDNDLYCSSYSDGVFTVKLIPSDASIRCNLAMKPYRLVMTTVELQLRSFEDETVIVAKWPYRFIRKYGYRDGNFMFEAGRSCETGEGIFRLDHPKPQEIFRCMSSKMKCMKKLINGESVSSLDCGESQLSAVLSMEAGSRSPLPPSPNQVSSQDTDTSPLHQSFASIRGFISSNDSLNNVSTSSSISVLKHIPHKPPRKGLTISLPGAHEEPSKDKLRNLPNYEPIALPLHEKPALEAANTDAKPPQAPERDYESIETITDAWRTLGIDEVKHTEQIHTPEEDLIEFVKTTAKVTRPALTLALTDVHSPEADCTEGDYDRLEFFRSNSKASATYKTVIPIKPPTPPAAKPRSDDYEIVGDPDTQACRLADDSYMGYGVLRKPQQQQQLQLEAPELDHHKYNGLDYAIVSKPKRKSSNHKYCLLFKASRNGIERLEIADSETDKNPRIVTLENCVKITTAANLIHIVTKTENVTVGTHGEEELKKWLSALQTVAFKEKSTCSLNRGSAIEEDNDLYCSSYSDGVFTVKLIPSDASIRCNLAMKPYRLVMTTVELQLRSFEDETVIVAKWPYRFIRKYGYRDGNFMFEAGRSCETGEGIFRLDHPKPQEIFRCMSSKMKCMKKLINGESVSSLDCGESQLSAVLSMEAGSRSPLPPSPNQVSSQDTDTSPLHQSFASIRGFISSNDSLNNVSTSSSISVLKHIPHKPPRKGLTISLPGAHEEPSKDKLRNLPNYEPIALPLHEKPALEAANTDAKPPQAPERDYESIETITDAWRTLGIDEVKHTEQIHTPEEDLIEFVKTTAKVTRPALTLALTDVHSPEADCTEGDYDRLEFFRSNSKASATYKTVIPIKPPTPPAAKPRSDDYEIVGDPDTQACRLADDSYMGYGVLRKPQQQLQLEAPELDHHKYNGLDYAIVSKPKRV